MTYLENLVAKTGKMIQRWHGYEARMFELTSSHQTLRVVIARPESGQNLVVSLIGPLFVCGPTSWANNEVAIEVLGLDSGKQGITMLDKSHGVKILAESFELAENAKL